MHAYDNTAANKTVFWWRQELKKTERDLRNQIIGLAREYADLFHSKKDFIAGTSPVPVSGKVIGADEMENLISSSLDFWLTSGRFNTDFEVKLAKYIGIKKVLTCNSGSSANLLALTSLTSPLLGDKALQPGDEIITCATGFPTTVNPILNNNLVPVFLDVELPGYNIDVELLEEAITPRTRGIMLAHTLGNPFNLGEIMKVVRKHNLYLIEDTCDALGATYNGKKVGLFGDVATLSFYPAHHITMGEGGAVYCQNTKIGRALECLRDWGRDCWCAAGMDDTCKKRFQWQLGELPHGFDHKYTYTHLGYNLKITDMQAAIGLSQLNKLDDFIEKRRSNFSFLHQMLSEFEDVFIMPKATPNSEPSWFGFPLTVRETAPFSRDSIVKYLNANKIGTRLLFGGNLVRQPYMLGRDFRKVGSLDYADIVMKDSFWIGVYPGLSNKELTYMYEVMKSFLNDYQNW